MSGERSRLTLALLLSLLIHTMLLSLTFGGEALGLPGFSFPWRERRVEAPDLRVVLLPARVAVAEPAGPSVEERLQQALIEQTVDGGLALKPTVPIASIPARAAEVMLPRTEATVTVPAEPVSEMAAAAVPAKVPLRTEATSTPPPVPEVIAVARSAEPTFAVPPATPPPAIAVAASAPSPEIVTPSPRDASEVVQKQAEPEVQERAIEVAKPDPALQREAELQRQRKAEQLEAARIEAAKLEAARQEAAQREFQRETQRKEAARVEASRVAAANVEAQRQEIARQEAARVETARLEAARMETARLETQRQEAAKLAAAKLDSARQELARQEAARVEAARLAAAKLEAQRQDAARAEAARVEVARQEASRQEAVRQAATQAVAEKEAARVLAEKEEDARRIARREAMGRVLNEEADRRKATEAAAAVARPSFTPSPSLPYSLSTARRGRLWGRSDSNVELVQYVEAWARKIQFNTPVETVREVAKRPHTNPMVTVAIRSDGSVESVTFALSSGVAEVDEAIRRIIQSHASYPAFPPSLAREYDVIEVRRTWQFDTAVRLY